MKTKTIVFSSLMLLASGAQSAILEKQNLQGFWSNSSGQNQLATGNPKATLNVSAGATVTLDLTSSADSYLYLQDENGNLLMEDNNGGDGSHARISTFLDSGQYQLVLATAQTNQSAEFTLTTSHGSLQFQELIEVKSVSTFDWIYNDSGTGADDDFSVWRPNLTQHPGYYSLGDIGVGSHSGPGASYVIKGQGDILAAPLDYHLIWKDSGSGGDHDGSFWQPVAPSGYTCLGHIAQRNYNKPSTNLMRCVKSDYLLRGTAQWIWDDSGSGADWDAGVWKAAPANAKGLSASTFVSQRSQSNTGGDLYWVLNKDRINLPGFGLAADIDVFAQSVAPRVWMHSSEEYFPSSVAFFQANTHDTGSRLTTNESLGCASCTNPAFLDGERPSSSFTPESYVIVVPKGNGVTDLVYFHFYPYNRGKKVCIGVELFGTCLGSTEVMGNHVGDWEHFTVRLQDGQPSQVFLSQHSGGQTFNWGDSQIATYNGHPVIYSAKGSHGLYSKTGNVTYLSIPNGSDLVDESNAGTAWDTWNNLQVITWQEIGSYTGDLEWLNYQGDWGNASDGCGILESLSGECILNEGPSGPMLKNATKPDFAGLD